MTFWEAQRIVVTGGAGFFGSHLVERMQPLRPQAAYASDRADFDLLGAAAVERIDVELRPARVLLLAAAVGGLGANHENTGRFFNQNLLMGAHLIEQGQRARASKIVVERAARPRLEIVSEEHRNR